MDDGEGPAADASGIWMTYSELAAARGIARAGAIRLVQRQRWPRRAGSNDGLAHVLVPHDWAKPIARVPAKRQRPATQRPATTPPAVAAFQAAIDALTDQQAHERAAWGDERDRLLQRINGLELEQAARRAIGRFARVMRAWRGE